MDALQLRALEPEDLSYLYQLENDPDLWQVSETAVPYSKMLLRSYLENAHLSIYETRQLRLVVMDASRDKAIGLVDFYDFCPRNLRAGIGIVIFPAEERGKGWGKKALQLARDYAFEQLQLQQLYALIGQDNTASLRAFEAVGFVHTGTKKKWLRTATSYIDVYFYQLISPLRES